MDTLKYSFFKVVGEDEDGDDIDNYIVIDSTMSEYDVRNCQVYPFCLCFTEENAQMIVRKLNGELN